MRTIVCGGRAYADREHVFRCLDVMKPTLIISGMAGKRINRDGEWITIGADLLAVEWAKANGVPVSEYPAKWRVNGVYNHGAGPQRNQLMLDEGKPDVVMAFPGGTGTADMVRRAKDAGVLVLEFEADEPEPKATYRAVP